MRALYIPYTQLQKPYLLERKKLSQSQDPIWIIETKDLLNETPGSKHTHT